MAFKFLLGVVRAVPTSDFRFDRIILRLRWDVIAIVRELNVVMAKTRL